MSSIIKHRKKVGNKPETRHDKALFAYIDIDMYLSAIRLKVAGQDIQERGLSGTIFTPEKYNLPLL